MKLYPMPGTVLIEYIEPVEHRSSIVMPETFHREERRTGRIVAVADYKPVSTSCCPDCCPSFKLGMEKAPMEVQVGQYALFKLHTADVMSIAGRQFFSVREDDIQLVTDDVKEFEKLTVTT